MEGMLNKKDLSETDICAKCITPAVIQAGWDEAAQIRREVGFTKGRIIVRGKKEPRYYQRSAINAAVEAIAKGQNRILLVMATGTGKTYTAFQIIWRLWKAGQKKRILFLADRNVLIDQTMVNDFRPFGAAMAKLSTGAMTAKASPCPPPSTTGAASTPPTKSIWGYIRPSPARKSGKSSSASFRPAFSI
jgi:type I site-specific restriction endonuclease